MKIVDQTFLHSIYADPSGQKQTKPTIFDELRWATQHFDKPYEQVLQLISELHGPWSGMNKNVAGSLTNSNIAITKAVNASLKLDTSSAPSNIGRINNIIANDMPIELYREFISKFSSIHPLIFNYIQRNISQFPHFQEISNHVGSFSKLHVSINDYKLLDRNKVKRISSETSTKVITPIKDIINNSYNLVNTLFVRNIRPHNSSLIKADNNTGMSFIQDYNNEKRTTGAYAECHDKTIKRFGPTLQLCDSFFPLVYQSQNTNKLFSLKADNVDYTADRYNRPIVRKTEESIAKEENKSVII